MRSNSPASTGPKIEFDALVIAALAWLTSQPVARTAPRPVDNLSDYPGYGVTNHHSPLRMWCLASSIAPNRANRDTIADR